MLASHRHVAAMLVAVPKTVIQFVNVFVIIMEIHTMVVDQNVQEIPIVQ